MHELTKADQVWNRACLLQPPSSQPGDWALHVMLKAHGLIMNGGVLHCVELLNNTDELNDSMKGYRYFGFDQATQVILKAQQILPGDAAKAEAGLDREYSQIIPTDSTLLRRFEEHFAKHPEAYDSIR